ncbi:FAD-dependent oxidoreductase [Streptomyces sp. M19]
MLVEGRETGWAASGRNGGFCAASLTHGLGNGLARWPDELPELERLGQRNLDEIAATVERHGVDCDFERTGEIDVATAPHQVAELREAAAQAARLGVAPRSSSTATRCAPGRLAHLPRRAVRPYGRGDAAPAKLAWGLKRACQDLGVRVYEHTPPSGPSRTARAWPSAPRTAGSAPGGSRSAPTPSRPWCADCARTSSPCTTTR